MRKGFYSVITVAFVAMVLLAFTAASMVLSQQGIAASRELEAKRVADRQADALLAFNASLEEAVIDTTWAACGCNGTSASLMNSTNMLTALGTYMNNTDNILTDPAVSVTLSGLSVQAYNPANCNTSFLLNTTYNILTNSTNAKTLRSISDSRNVSTYNSSVEFDVNLTRSGGNYTLQVRCA